MSIDELNRYLHEHIPLSRHMQMRAVLLEPGRIQVHLPLQPNTNPHGTVFGGALTALGLASGWMLLHVGFVDAGVEAKLLGKRSEIDFVAPGTGDCVAEALCQPAELDRLIARYRERGHVRLALQTIIRTNQIEVARHNGVYTAIRPD
ncbi:MAG: YiiD C-terminal domain-containing protein [Panacagrimonas sp.]